MAVRKTKRQQRIETGEIIEQKCWQYIQELNSFSDERLDSTALIDCRRSYSYRQMFRRWERYAEVFSALNITGAHHARVGMLSEICAEASFAFYALNMTGASVSMLPFADANSKEHCTNLIQKERLTDLVLCDTKLTPELLGWLAKSREELGLGNIIVIHVPTEGTFVGRELTMFFRALAPQLRKIPGVLFMDQLLTQYEATPISFAKDGLQDDAVIVHTSGTTSGIHKPVPLSDRGMNEAAARFLRDERFAAFEGNAVTALLTDLTSAYMLADGMHLPFSFGGTVIALPLGYFNTRYFPALAHYKANLMFATPALLENMELAQYRPDLSSFSFIYVGGSAVSLDAKRRINEIIRRDGAQSGITIGYGLSELAGACILSDCDREDNAIGYPLPGVTAKIFDESDGKFHDLSDGQRTGVLYLSSASVSCGRLDDHEFFTLDEIDGKPFYNTYDLVSVAADGSMTYVGRTNKFFVNNEGVRFDAGLVETAVGAQPGIVQCGLAPEYTKLIHDTVPVLYVRTDAGSGDPVQTVRNALIGVFIRENNITRTNLPVQCVIADELPLTDLGKVDIHRIVNGEVSGARYKIQPIRANGVLKDVVLTPAEYRDTPLWAGVPEELEDMSGGIFKLFSKITPNQNARQSAQQSGQPGAAQAPSGCPMQEGMNMFMKAFSNPFLLGALLRPRMHPRFNGLAALGFAAGCALGYVRGMAGPGVPGQGNPAQGAGAGQGMPPQGPGLGCNPPAPPMQGLGCAPGNPPQGFGGGQGNPMQGLGCNPPVPPMQGLGCAPGNPPQGFGGGQGMPPQGPGLGCAPGNPSQGFDPMKAMGVMSPCFHASASNEFYED